MESDMSTETEQKTDILGEGVIRAICLSPEKGTGKTEVREALLRENHGLVGDAHAGSWHRQISLLPEEEIAAFRKKGGSVEFGAFGENFVVSGLPRLRELPVGSRIFIGENLLLEVSQIGKACHDHCAIFCQIGDCIMPREGIFALVKRGGPVRVGDRIVIRRGERTRPFTAAVITLSDRASQGVYEDQSGPVIVRMLTEKGYEVKEVLILPDGKEKLAAELRRLSDQRQLDLVLTTGGTGFSPRDLTPEATREVSDREVPGIGEALRAYSLRITDHAMLSRQTAGIRKHTLIINLPGRPKACRENLEYLLPPLEHGLHILRGDGE